MRAVTVLFLTSVSLTIGLAMPAPAMARQSIEPLTTASVEAVSAPGVDATRLLRMPASLFAIVADEEAQTPSAPGAAPAATPASQSVKPFVPAKISKVIYYALQMTFYEHVMRVATQDFTREQLKGKFWPEYFDSIHVPQRWGDKDGWQVNYLGHAMSGGAFTRIWLEQRERKPTTKSEYLKSVGRATIFTALCSIQYEVGPMSEASIGNVGLNPDDLGWNDYIWTPIGGVLWTMAEDAIDKYALTYIDKHVPFMMAKAAARMILNPSRMLANIGMNRSPWSRYDRTMMGEPTGHR